MQELIDADSKFPQAFSFANSVTNEFRFDGGSSQRRVNGRKYCVHPKTIVDVIRSTNRSLVVRTTFQDHRSVTSHTIKRVSHNKTKIIGCRIFSENGCWKPSIHYASNVFSPKSIVPRRCCWTYTKNSKIFAGCCSQNCRVAIILPASVHFSDFEQTKL